MKQIAFEDIKVGTEFFWRGLEHKTHGPYIATSNDGAVLRSDAGMALFATDGPSFGTTFWVEESEHDDDYDCGYAAARENALEALNANITLAKIVGVNLLTAGQLTLIETVINRARQAVWKELS